MIRRLVFPAAVFVLSVCTLAADENESISGIRLAPARVELELAPGAEATFVLTIESASSVPARERIVVALRDWSMSREGTLAFHSPSTQPRSAAGWILYSPSESVVTPGQSHFVRVTVSVPAGALPGDHLAALVVEPRLESLKHLGREHQMMVRYLMASMIYVKVPGLTRRGTLNGLAAQSRGAQVIITPTLKNEGNTVLRPGSTLQIANSNAEVVAEVRSEEMLPVLAASELSTPITIEKELPPGKYSVRYRVDFRDGDKAEEGLTELIVPVKRKRS